MCFSPERQNTDVRKRLKTLLATAIHSDPKQSEFATKLIKTDAILANYPGDTEYDRARW